MTSTSSPIKSRGRIAVQLDDGIWTPTVFPGVLVGVFTPGVPVALADLGLTERAVKLLIEDGLPLKLTRVGDKED